MTADRFKNITLQQMEILVDLIDAGSFTKASTRLFLTQPSLTKQIQNMEEAVGSRLINRGPGGITLTPEGRIMYEYARRILRLRDDAKRRISQLKEEESGHIYISASTIPSTYIIPKLLGTLKKTYPNIQVHINSHDSEEVIQIVLHGEAELGFIGKEPTHKKLMAERIWKDCLVLAVPLITSSQKGRV